MAQKSSNVEIAQRYTNALYCVAQEQLCGDVVATELAEICALVSGNRDLKQAFQNPAISRLNRVSLCQALRKKMKLCATSGKFLCLLARKGRLNLLVYVQEQYNELLAMGRGETKVEVISANILGDEEVEKLKKKLEELTGNLIFIDNKIDKYIIAGLIIKMGSRMFDFSVRARLKRITYIMEGV